MAGCAVVLTLAVPQVPGPQATLEGVGPLRFGMTTAAAARALHRPRLARQLAGRRCAQFTARIGGHDWLVMSENGIVVRVDVSDSLARAPRGARVGLAEDSVQALFDHQLRVRQHEYLDGHYLTWVAPDTTRRLVFETNRGVVTEWRIGLWPPVGYLEGCS